MSVPGSVIQRSVAQGMRRIDRALRSQVWLVALMRSRLFQFLVVGGLIFFLAPRPTSSDTIEISQGTLVSLAQAQARRLGVDALSSEETAAVTARAVEDELLYREGLRLGLDRGDDIVRQRLIEKVLLLAEDLGGASQPVSETELRNWFAAHADRYRQGPAVRFLHVFMTSNRRAALAPLLATLREAPPSEEAPALGEPFPWPRAAPLTPQGELVERFGPEFADAVAALPVGVWSGPVASRYGLHLVRVLQRDEAELASFDAVRAQVRVEYSLERKQRATQAWLDQAARRYHVTVAGRDRAVASSTGRAAIAPGRGE